MLVLDQGSANFLSRGLTNEMISFDGPQLLCIEKHSAYISLNVFYTS